MWRFIQNVSQPVATTDVTSSESDTVKEEIRLRKRKNSSNQIYDEETRAKVAKWAILNGNASAVKKFNMPESTVRNFKKKFNELTKESDTHQHPTAITTKQRGRPLKLGSLDKVVQRYITDLAKEGSAINRHIIKSMAHGVIKYHMPSSYGKIDLSDGWAKSIMDRMNLVKRKGTKAARKLPEDFLGVKKSFLTMIKGAKEQHSVPDELIVNWDQTGVKIVPQMNYTMALKGSKQVPLVAIDDKREITALLAISAAGKMLNPQIIYAGTTDRCHPSPTPFPKGWDIFHSKSHWSTEETMHRYIEKIITPYLSATKELLGLKSEQKSICIFDVFAAHRTTSFLELLSKSNIMPIYVPASCTSELQPLDLTVNDVFKKSMKDQFADWYSEKVFEGLANNKGGAVPKVNMNLSAMKPIHAKWMVESVAKLESADQLIKRGFYEAGIIIRPEVPASEADTEPFHSEAESNSIVVVTKK